ncbi:MAG: hypothetical protein UW81_C0019G0017 [Candidatus Giovannonibacteria bacterium GW2011_GWC2_44_9]|uniref:Uncharacterized protein n=3 Tax=Candidatus Giovannoniibacteriota TaxID=1752738 RepID=A0A0G1IUU5_9BACT|nr:MAG: hypothetical protein UW49_C0017G0017 [Candidatus Giovannonibacteria bacterium GW2011_GWB1_44_23]KKT62905.1 MAG: hypothetical protein UW57_C0012G0017 [Candidatus Giovannonibacteria bacterium GW2011_GWA1_44_29]KKT83410.1 MAG: hypothetical protein UW81_C0019G0017 [Candidatus Giovannonibacteria bacterium GW2011_GWC2_44_9]KKT91099.1 MAG: hypothetical protein UW93_C0013G0017 [Parcubacteria group bacterium GW2011_GWC1_45_13]
MATVKSIAKLTAGKDSASAKRKFCHETKMTPESDTRSEINSKKPDSENSTAAIRRTGKKAVADPTKSKKKAAILHFA